jgi:hypothetical protein
LLGLHTEFYEETNCVAVDRVGQFGAADGNHPVKNLPGIGVVYARIDPVASQASPGIPNWLLGCLK